jgi:copper chaperone
MRNEKIKIEGMSCGHCVMAVKKELSKLPVKVKSVSIGSAEVEYDESKVKYGEIRKAVNEAGYSVVENIQS